MQRDDAWFERFHERHHANVAAYCARRVGSVDGADATAQVLSVAWRRIEDLPDGDSGLRWLYGVARRVLGHQWRSTSRARRLTGKVAALPVEPQPGPEAIAQSSAEHQLVREAVMSLRAVDREVLLLSAWEGLTHAEIADVTGLSHAAVDKRVARANVPLAHRYQSLAGDGSKERTARPGITRSPVRAQTGGGQS